MEIKGRYAAREGGIRVHAQIINTKLDKVIIEYTQDIVGENTTTDTLGPTTRLATARELPIRKRKEQLERAIREPNAPIKGTQVFAADNGEFALEILVAPRLDPAPACTAPNLATCQFATIYSWRESRCRKKKPSRSRAR